MKEKIKIGIFGSAINEDEQIRQKARALGELLAQPDLILITGASSGLPYEVVYAAYQKKQVEIWGYSPAYNYDEQTVLISNEDNSIYSRLIYVSPQVLLTTIESRRKYRNVLSTDQCDAGIIVSGRIGTLNEFTNLYDMGKVIGIFTNTGGVADELEVWLQKIDKPSNATIIFEGNPQSLVEKAVTEVYRRRLSETTRRVTKDSND